MMGGDVTVTSTRQGFDLYGTPAGFQIFGARSLCVAAIALTSCLSSEVCFREQIGKHSLVLGFTGFDPNPT
jgi:hypothetical protein